MGGRLTGKVALISGAASGLGAAEAALFAREGARVVIGDVQAEQGQAVADAIVRGGGQAAFITLDVTEAASWQAAVRFALSRFGALTTLVNNAGIFRMGGVMTTTQQSWSDVIAVNQTGPLLGMQAAAPALLAAKGAAIVNISSIYAVTPSPDAMAYHASKSALLMMSRAAALEFARQGIRVNTILPGRIDTPISGDIAPDQLAAVNRRIPMGWTGDPIDIAQGALYLASDDARYVTGAELIIDGGWYASAGSLIDPPEPAMAGSADGD
ncbi:glucose 1-dehydrogenase [Sphingomonas histidinilytica]|jgi:2,5-dichloro-2,5-cyclohexadiene-1,4-diol dehydrogenase 2|uniref:2,5-dichloro-2,5-cyclohexadiene-1,4-diol dehydrogenase 2 n=1 Tax=Rhizorhabdus histidinilytica TaxID=439228 RepID=A0A1T5GTC1_9SPHN|nr:glucose 1-dehydrogenase [Rhizorhabdus histidinilytica]MBO9378907.1 glucose 1-dehydrogenase [Rhizorhabdus histidinilytica]QEH77859.1 glucose 1-dehydrogenase [Sphingomonas sp. C8-2]SKC11560.1 2,5-dichloro-2,5-cyclohexadiene-1,4-diol dehydrogenase 2 [Rhizorhabdus histidinilytica]